MNVWLREIWSTWRAMFRRPGYLMLATGVLALGIGVSVTVFTLIDAVLLRPLPYPQASQLVQLGQEKFGVAYYTSPLQYQHLLPLQGVQSIGLIEGMASHANIAGDGVPELVPVVHADRGLLPTLGVVPILGRNFTEAEDRPNGPKAVMLSHGFWMRRYASDDNAVGRTLLIEGLSYTVVGVLPEGIDLKHGDLVLPFALPVISNSHGDGNNERAIARLAPGADVASVSAQVDARMHAMYDALGGVDKARKEHQRFLATDLKTSMRVFARPVLMMFLASALLVLSIALVNLTNLVLLRTLSRSHDAAVREALGASWGRRMLPILAEGLLIGLGGTLVGLGFAWLGLALLRGLIPPEWLVGSRLQIGASAGTVALGLGMAGALLAVVLGAWHGMASSSVGELREGGRSGMGQRGGLLGRALVVAQVALATTLLCAAGLFLHALYDAARAPLGFSSQGILTFELAPVQVDYPDTVAVQKLTRQVLDQLRVQPGVELATVTTGLPTGDFSQNFYLGSIHAPGEQAPENSPQFRSVGPDFFATFDITPHEGRAFQPTDAMGGEPVAIVNQALARQMYAGQALGKTIDLDIRDVGDSNRVLAARIVGVIDNISPFGPFGAQEGMMYLPISQMPDDLMQLFRGFNSLRFAIRVRGNPDDYRRIVAAAVAGLAPNQPIANVQSMQSIVQGTTADTRLNLLLIGIFAVLALVLAAVGIYAVMSVAVAIREREFGVRMAIGASPLRLVQIVLRGGLLQIAIGLSIGLGLAFVLAGVLRAVLTQINRSVFDLPVLLTVCVVLTMVGLLACLLPALRASRVQPMRALRGE
ncbi:MAG: ADOP family duplicated permease [Rhodanobacter sp.]